MKGKRKKRLLALLIASVMILSAGLTEMGPVFAASYVDSCTSYDSSIDVMTKENTAIMSQPCNATTNSSSTELEKVAPDTVLHVSGLYQNTVGEYWYEVIRYGTTCYVLGEDTTFIEHKTGDVAIADVVSPASLGYGKSFGIGGTITSSENMISDVKVAMYPKRDVTRKAVLESSAAVNGYSYSLAGSSIDYALTFGSLDAGTYTYVITADAASNYVAEDGTLATSTRTVILEEKQCVITDEVSTSTANYFGIDVSTWQEVDWATTSQYVDFAVFRSSFSTTTDSEFYNNLAGCEEYDVPFGLYVYSYAESVDEAIAEAEHVVSIIKGHDLDLPIFFDMEDPVVDATSNSTKEAMLIAFCQVVEAAGYEAGLYTGLSWLENYFGSSSYIHSIPIWCAQWYSYCQYGGGVQMWQNSETGSIPGISGSIDTDYYYGELPGKTTDTSYVTKCEYYPTNVTLSATATTTIKTLPCYFKVDTSSLDVVDVTAGTELHATGLYKNTLGEYWYQVETGTYAGYVSASNVSVVDFIYDDVTIVNPSMADNLSVGQSYWIKGELNSQYNTLKTVYANMYQGEQTTATPVTGNSYSPYTKCYDLNSSEVDAGLYFSKMTEGYYTYEISADIESYYVENGALASKTENVVVWNKPFTVGASTISHSHTAGEPVQENVVVGTSYDLVTYCTGCGAEMNRETVNDSSASVPVTGISLNKNSVSLVEGNTTKLTATVTPTNATNKTVSWGSSNSAVATVDASGKVTAVSAGSATITATAGSKSATCLVTVTAIATEPSEPENPGTGGNTEVSEGTFYNSYINVITNAAVSLMTNPWSHETNSSSTVVTNVAADTVLFVEGLYKNTLNEYWYKVVYYGNTCYVKADTTTFKDHKTGDVTATEIYSPASLGYGKSFSIGGKISSTMNALSKVTAAVYPGTNKTKAAEISASASASDNYYDLANSTIDYNLPFGSLAHGEHKYVISADAVSYYIAADGTLTSSTRTVILEEKQCIVTNAVNSSTADYFGIDVSTWQSVDWATTSQYIDFAIFRSSFSTTTDSEFYNNLAGCETYGVPFGLYVYSYADTVDEAIAEAEHVVSIISGHDVALPIYFDMEDPVVDATSNSTKEAMLKAFCEVIQAAGYEAGLYTGLSWLDYYFGSSTYIHTIPIWCAQWYSQCQYTGGVRMWQYSETGSIPGISGTVDTNYYYGELPGKSTDTSYLSKCTSYPSNLTVSTNATTTIKKYPCYYAVDSSSTDVADVAADTELHATAVYKNTNGEYWYQVENGTYAGYISASNASVTAFIYDDVTVVSPAMANNINVGSAYSIAGELNSQYNKMSKVHASVYSGEQTTATPVITSNYAANDSYYDLYNSQVDWYLPFGDLTEGYYTYEISADVTNYYVSGGSLTSETENVVVWTKPFTVGDVTVEIPDSGVTPDPTPDPQPATVTISGHTVPSSITEGGVFIVAGIITASENLTNVTVGCYDASGNAVTSSSATPNATTYDISNLDNYIEFNTLTAGTYTYKVTATTATGGTVTLVDEGFTVKSASTGTTDDSLKVTNLIVPGSYDEGMTFDITGTVTADNSITEVTVGIYDENGNAISVGTANPNTTSYDLAGLNGSVDFASLTYGTYYYKITATTTAGSKELYNGTFTVYPERDYTFIYDYNVPEVLVEGEDFELEGTIVTQGSMTRVNIGVYDVNGNGMAFVTYEPKNTKFHFENLEESLDFSTLAPGMYYYRIIVVSDLKGIERIIDYPFVVLSKDQTVADGTYSFVPYTNSGFAIQVKGKSDNSGANVVLGTKANTKYQALNAKYEGNGYYSLQFVGSGKNLTVTNAGTVIGTNVKQSTYTGSDAQLWQILPMGDSYFLVPKHAPDLCLTVASGNVAGSNINLSLKDLTDDKRYTLVATDGTYSDDVVEAPENFKLSGATLQLENDITVIIKTKVAYVGDLLNPYVIVEQELQNGEIKTTQVEGVLSSDGTEYHFLYEGLEACQVGDDFVATIYAYDTNGNLVKGGQSAPYSAKKYCTSMFKKTATQLGISETKFAKMKTLLVDLLNYSAAAQKYFAYKTDTLVNADLSAELQALASLDSVLDSVENHTEIAYEKIDNPTVTWKGATLILLNKVYVRVNLQYAGDVSNIKAVFEFEGGESYEVTEFTEYGDGLYYADFDQVTAFQMGVPICIKIMEGDNVISDTARYSVSSYVYKYKDDETTGEVVREMMKYGMAAVAYNVTE